MHVEYPPQPGHRRFKLTLEYDGGPFRGWEGGPAGQTIETVLQAALAPFHDGPDSNLTVAGRTDAGVHASAQVAHVDLRAALDPYKIQSAINGRVRPWPVSALAVEPVADDFNARFSAIRRRYCYRILNRRAPPALLKGRVWHVPIDLEIEAMAEAARLLLGKHDFSSFRAAQCQAKSPLRTLESLTVARAGEEILFHAGARAFLHHQVRNMVGSLVEVGRGARSPDWMTDVLNARKRSAAGPTAPPDGLCLIGVDYPAE